MKHLFSMIALAVLAISLAPLQAQMYRYVDESGQVIYTQFKPADHDQVDTVKPPPPPPSSAEASRKALTESIAREQDKKQDEEKQQVQQQQVLDEKTRNQKNCDAARNNLKVLQEASSYQRIMRDGQEVKFDDKQRQMEIRKAQDMIKKSCQ